MQSKFLLVNKLSKKIDGNDIIQNISFTIPQNFKLALIGESGSGKTTLLKMIAGLIEPTSGEIFFKIKKILGPNEQLIPGHKEIQFLSQQYELHNNYFVKDLLWFDNKLATYEAEDLFLLCNISHLLHRKTSALSGGEKQRIALCKLLIKKPSLLILDEPFSNLDFEHKQALKKVLNNIFQKIDLSIILSSHEPNDTLSWADEMIVLQKGKILQKNTPKMVYEKPVNKYVASLLGPYNFIENKNIVDLASFYSTTKNIIIRPEDIEIASLNEANCVGKIVKIEFMGMYYLIDVLINEITICFISLHVNDCKINQTISLKIDSSKFIEIE